MHDKQTGNKSFIIVAKFDYLEETLTKQYCICEEIKCILKLGNSWYRSVQFAIKIYEDQIVKNIFPPFILYGCETWCLKLWKKHWLRVFENRVAKTFEWNTKFSDITKCGEFLDHLKNNQFSGRNLTHGVTYEREKHEDFQL
jgi:hypothetical protein